MDGSVAPFWAMVFGSVLFLISISLSCCRCCSRNTNPEPEAPQSASQSPQDRIHELQHQLQEQLIQEQRRFVDWESAMASLPPLRGYDERRMKEVAAACTECAICLGEYGSDGDGVRRRTLKPCGHRFHEACVDEWLLKESRCPVCRGVSVDSSTSVHGKGLIK